MMAGSDVMHHVTSSYHLGPQFEQGVKNGPHTRDHVLSFKNLFEVK